MLNLDADLKLKGHKTSKICSSYVDTDLPRNKTSSTKYVLFFQFLARIEFKFLDEEAVQSFW